MVKYGKNIRIVWLLFSIDASKSPKKIKKGGNFSKNARKGKKSREKFKGGENSNLEEKEKKGKERKHPFFLFSVFFFQKRRIF